jgi:hypothetical protein
MAKKGQEYTERSRQLNHLQASSMVQRTVRPSSAAPDVAKLEIRGAKAYRLAREQHEAMKWHDAQKAYDDAAQLFIQAGELSRDTDDRRRLSDRAELAMTGSQQLQSARHAGATSPHPDTQLAPPSTMADTAASQAPIPVPSGERLSADELAVLMHTSNVNGRLYNPWIAQDVAEPMTGPEGGFVDRDGKLKLSDKQVS